MGETTGISWTDATFNPWWGCVEVSPACDSCYARTFAHRIGHDIWGKDAPRRFFTDKHWDEPVKWSRAAEKEGVRCRVFCASMADVMEQRNDAVGWQMEQARKRLWALIAATPHLDWLLLTKRPQFYERVPVWIRSRRNVWPGTTVESAEYLWRAEALLKVEFAGPRWLSVEPLLGLLDLCEPLGIWWNQTTERWFKEDCPRPDWVIVGGESGPHHRPMDLAWARSIRDQCHAAGTAYFFKQAGGLRPGMPSGDPELDECKEFPGVSDYPTVLALDLATATGWATNVHGRIESGVQSFEVKRGESPGMRFVRFNAWLSQWAPDGWRPGLIVYEQAHHRGGAATEVAAGFSTRVHEFCARHGIQHAAIHSATLKKWTTGSGRGDKLAMRDAAIGRGWIGPAVSDDNEVDAIALLHYAMAELVPQETP